MVNKSFKSVLLSCFLLLLEMEDVVRGSYNWRLEDKADEFDGTAARDDDLGTAVGGFDGMSIGIKDDDGNCPGVDVVAGMTLEARRTRLPLSVLSINI